MKSTFVCRQSVRVTIISETNARTFFQILVVASSRPYTRTFYEFFRHFMNFLQIFFVSVNMGPCGSENFKMLLFLQITAKSFQTCLEFSSQWSSQNFIWDF